MAKKGVGGGFIPYLGVVLYPRPLLGVPPPPQGVEKSHCGTKMAKNRPGDVLTPLLGAVFTLTSTLTMVRHKLHGCTLLLST